MDIPNPFRRRDANTRRCWGYTFQWTPGHMTEEQMHPLKFSYDVLGEECLNILDEISPPVRMELPRSQGKMKVDRDLYAILRDNRSEHEKLAELWQQVNTIPDWVDWEQIARGQDVFYRYGGLALTGVRLLSFHFISSPSPDLFPGLLTQAACLPIASRRYGSRTSDGGSGSHGRLLHESRPTQDVRDNAAHPPGDLFARCHPTRRSRPRINDPCPPPACRSTAAHLSSRKGKAVLLQR